MVTAQGLAWLHVAANGVGEASPRGRKNPFPGTAVRMGVEEIASGHLLGLMLDAEDVVEFFVPGIVRWELELVAVAGRGP